MSNVGGIDQNDKGTWRALNETTGLVEPVRVDPILNALYVYVVDTTGSATGDVLNAAIDENDNPTLLAYNETTGLISGLRCDDDGNLLAISV